jgi:hypothetical protein
VSCTGHEKNPQNDAELKRKTNFSGMGEEATSPLPERKHAKHKEEHQNGEKGIWNQGELYIEAEQEAEYTKTKGYVGLPKIRANDSSPDKSPATHRCDGEKQANRKE